MITPETIQQITNRIDIIDVVGDFVKLKKRGANYLGNCPFHNEKTPSFTVSPSKEIYKCFGCGKSGNTITFLMEHEKYSYVEALRWLAGRYNIEIEETAVTDEVKQQQLAAESLFILNSFAQKFFNTQLTQTEEGQGIALSYLTERGFSAEILDKFQVGYDPQSGNAFSNAARAHQFNPEILTRAGLSVIRNEELFDNYRGRIIFPIHNNSGKILGFGARVIGKADKAPKYINTPENEIYVKSKILYGLYFARQAIDKSNECFLVEGYTDVISLHQAGIENVVASGGTSLTIEQLRLIKKYTSNLTILYDGDAAGIKAAMRGLDMALEESLNVQLALIPDGEDPDSYIKKYGSSGFKDFIAGGKKDFIIFQLDVMLKEAGTDVSKKNEVVNHIAETLSKINKAEDFTRKQEYIKQCAALLRIDETGLTNLVNTYTKNRINKEEKKAAVDTASLPETTTAAPDDAGLLLGQDDAQEKNLMKVLLEYGLNIWAEDKTIAQYIFEETEVFNFDNPEIKGLFNLYRTQYEQGLQPTAKSLLYHEEVVIRNLITNLTVSQYELSHRWDEVLENMNILNRDTSHQDVSRSLNYFKLRKLKRMFQENQEELEKAKDFKQQMSLMEVHKALKKIEMQITQELGTVIIK